MSRTRLLVWILALVALLQIFPDKAGRIEIFAVIAAVIYCAAWVIPKYISRRKSQATRAALATADEQEYLEYAAALHRPSAPNTTRSGTWMTRPRFPRSTKPKSRRCWTGTKPC
jgi:hypothetical protein